MDPPHHIPHDRLPDHLLLPLPNLQHHHALQRQRAAGRQGRVCRSLLCRSFHGFGRVGDGRSRLPLPRHQQPNDGADFSSPLSPPSTQLFTRSPHHNKNDTQLLSGERAWVLLLKLHFAQTLALVVALAVALGLRRDLSTVLSRNVVTSQFSQGSLKFSWGFAFHILAILTNVALLLVLVTATSEANTNAGGGGVVLPPQQLEDDGAEREGGAGQQGKLKEALLDRKSVV